MDIIISNDSDKPIYEQIYEQIKAQILSGQLKEGDALPSMRLLAKELRISIITTKRTYEELERDGYIEAYSGKGCFVEGISKKMAKETIMYEIEEDMERIIKKAKLGNISIEELSNILLIMYQEEDK